MLCLWRFRYLAIYQHFKLFTPFQKERHESIKEPKFANSPTVGLFSQYVI